MIKLSLVKLGHKTQKVKTNAEPYSNFNDETNFWSFSATVAERPKIGFGKLCDDQLK
jgi:hypothetical protein